VTETIMVPAGPIQHSDLIKWLIERREWARTEMDRMNLPEDGLPFLYWQGAADTCTELMQLASSGGLS
jgi:hypothetical protein